MTLSITSTNSVAKRVIVTAGSFFSAAIAKPKKHEKTRICRISLLAIAAKKLDGKTWVKNSFRFMPPVLRLVAASFSGNARSRFAPGCSQLANSMPVSSDTSDAVMNHASALPPMRPTALASPMPAMPATTVPNTSGAITILIRRRKMSDSSEK